MNYLKLLSQMIGFVVLMLFFTACAASSSAPTPIPPTPTVTPVLPTATATMTPVSTPIPPTPTAEPVLPTAAATMTPVSTPIPPTPTAEPVLPTETATMAPVSTPIPLSAATVIASQDDKEWDLVVIGDSLIYEQASRYSAHLEQDLGIKVNVQNLTRDGCGSSCLLRSLRIGPELKQSLSEAEVVIFDMGPARFAGPVWRYASDSPDSCGGTDNQDCLREALKAYQEDTDGIFAEIVSLCSPSETLIRTMDIHQIEVKELKEAEAFDVVNSYWREANEHLSQVATEHHIPVAQVYAAFMGATGDEDPRDKGLVQSDGLHPTGEGADLIAELFRNLGYEYAPQQP